MIYISNNPFNNQNTPFTRSPKVEQYVQNIHQHTGFSLNLLYQMSSDDLLMIDVLIEDFKIICELFNEDEIFHNLELIIDHSVEFTTLNTDQIRDLKGLRRLSHQPHTFPQAIISLLRASVSSNPECIPNTKFLEKYNQLIKVFLELQIDLHEFLESIPLISDNAFFANQMPEEFRLLCHYSQRQPIQILSMEPKKFVYFLAKAKFFHNKILDKKDALNSFDHLYDLPLEKLKSQFPYTNLELRAFTTKDVTSLVPKSQNDIRTLSYNLSPIDVERAKSENVMGGHEIPFYPLMLAALKETESDPAYAGNSNILTKIEKLKDALLLSWNIGLIYYPSEIRAEYNSPKRVEARTEIATQLILTRLHELSANGKKENFDVIFHGGWQGHAIMYGISYQSETDSYTFSLWNTGNGLQHHPKLSEEGIDPEIGDFNDSPIRYKIRATWNELSLQQVADQQFLEMLLCEQVKNSFGDPSLTYEKINRHFGKPQESNQHTKAGFHRAQKYGNCSWKSFWAMTADLLERDIDPVLAGKVKLKILEIFDKTVSLTRSEKIDLATIDHLLAQSVKTKVTKLSGKLK